MSIWYIFLWSDFELQKSLQKIVFIKNSLYLHYLCKSFKFQFVTFYWTIYGLIDLSMSDFFWDFLLFFFVHYFNYLKDLYFYIFILLLKWSNFSLMFLSLILLICQWMSEFNLRTVRAIAKARKIVQISICVFDLQRYIYVILSKSKWHILLSRMFVIHFQVFRYTFGGVS